MQASWRHGMIWSAMARCYTSCWAAICAQNSPASPSRKLMRRRPRTRASRCTRARCRHAALARRTWHTSKSAAPAALSSTAPRRTRRSTGRRTRRRARRRARRRRRRTTSRQLAAKAAHQHRSRTTHDCAAARRLARGRCVHNGPHRRGKHIGHSHGAADKTTSCEHSCIDHALDAAVAAAGGVDERRRRRVHQRGGGRAARRFTWRCAAWRVHARRRGCRDASFF